MKDSTQGRFGRVRTTNGSVHYARYLEREAELLDAPPWQGHRSGERVPLGNLQALAPLAPSKILGIGRNYGAHAREMGGTVPSEPLVFAKLPSALLASGGTVVLPPQSSRVDHEAELGVVVGRRARNVRAEDAFDFVFGYVPLCDVTARDLQQTDGQWTRAKGFDTFCPVGPQIVSGIDPRDLAISCSVNGAVRQSGSTRDMIFDVAHLIAHLSSFTTLEPGDLIATGTPEGVGPLAPGDSVVVRVGDIEELVFRVASGE